MASTYICPVCKCNIEMRDSSLHENYDPMFDSNRLLINTEIRHNGSFENENCVYFFQAFIQEQQEIMKQTMIRITSTFSGKANLLD